jgi:hypothetical protein
MPGSETPECFVLFLFEQYSVAERMRFGVAVGRWQSEPSVFVAIFAPEPVAKAIGRRRLIEQLRLF